MDHFSVPPVGSSSGMASGSSEATKASRRRRAITLDPKVDTGSARFGAPETGMRGRGTSTTGSAASVVAPTPSVVVSPDFPPPFPASFPTSSRPAISVVVVVVVDVESPPYSSE